MSNRLYTFVEGFGIAIESLRANKVRAGLTILGVAIGVFVVVAISAAIHGINAGVAKAFESTGPTTFFVSRFPISFENCDGTGETCKWLRNPPLDFNELRDIRAISTIRLAGARLDRRAEVRYADRRLSSASVIGFTPEWTAIEGNTDIFPGRSFTDAENMGGAPVVVINDVMATRLFGESDPLEKEVRIRGVPFRVIGVYKKAPNFFEGGESPEAIVPITAAVRRLNADEDEMAFAVVPHGNVERDVAIDDVTAYLRGRRGQRPAEESSFAIITQDKLFETWGKITGMFFLVAFALSSVGLIVGGVGVVAIMMISVTERTREIGVRKALGATRATIMLQFLVEAVTLTGIGGAAGLLAGWLLALLVRNVSSIPASVQPGAVFLALAASAATGVLFGLFPAARAARLDPVEALRYE